MQITRLGHAAVLVESAGRRVLIDPGAFSSPAAFTRPTAVCSGTRVTLGSGSALLFLESLVELT